jgi:toxin ParE1/3/4
VSKTFVRWSAEAIDDLESIEEFIGRDSPRYGAMVVELLVQSVDLLEDHPNAGRIVPEIGRPEFRELIRDTYRIVYRNRDGGIAADGAVYIADAWGQRVQKFVCGR